MLQRSAERSAPAEKLPDEALSGRGRVLMLTSNFPRWEGDSTTPFVLHLAQDLQALGWTVDVLAPHGPGAAASETLGGVRVERFRYLWPERAETVCYQGGALVNLRRSRSNLLKLPALVGAELGALAARLASRRYDLVHSHWILPQGFVAALAAPPLRTPHVLTAHGGDVFALRGGLLERFKRRALCGADAVTVNSSATETAVWRIAPQVRVLRRIPMGVSERAAEPAKVAELRARHRRGEGPLLLFVGRLVEEKGVEDFLRALGLVAARLPDATGLVVGDGQERGRFEALAAELGLAGRTAFTGWAPPSEIASYYGAADVFVGPSRTGPDGWVEAQGLTFVEAMMAGVPVVASRVGGVVDAVRDGETGLLAEERAPEELAAAVLRLADDEALAARLSLRARAEARGRFTRTGSAAAFSALFETMRRRR